LLQLLLLQKERDYLDIKHEKWVSALGLMCLVFGGMLLLMRIAVGNLSDDDTSSSSGSISGSRHSARNRRKAG
jgi:hypothetical protein